MKNTSRLGGILADHMKKTAKAGLPMGLDLGRITDQRLTLVTDKLRVPIPRGSYSTLGTLYLEAGYRVVVAWIANEPVILGRLVST